MLWKLTDSFAVIGQMRVDMGLSVTVAAFRKLHMRAYVVYGTQLV